MGRVRPNRCQRHLCEIVLRRGGSAADPFPAAWIVTATRALSGMDGLVLSGGEDIHPAWYHAEPSPHLYPPSRERDLFELALFAAARQLQCRYWAFAAASS